MLTQPAAAARDIDLLYKIYLGGFNIIELKVDIGFRPSAYEFAARAKSVGMIGRMFPWWMKAYSKGHFSDGAVAPVSSGQRNNWRGKDRFIDLKFANGVAKIDRILPKPEADNREPVPVEMRTGVVDLASAIIALIRNMDNGQPCRAQMPVFDGRRRYDLIAVPDGSDNLRPSGHTPYSGETVNCRLSIEKKVGFKRTDESGWKDKKRSARVWMARALGNVPPLPVRLTINTRLGAVVAHLNSASVETAGKTIRLIRATPLDR